jgi:putative endonuclease
MNLLNTFKTWFSGKTEAEHLRRGRLGERAAQKFLQKGGMKFLTANYRSPRGEIDLIFRTRERSDPVEKPGGLGQRLMAAVHFLFHGHGTGCLVFVEVKTRSSEQWARPAAAVDAAQRLHITKAALDYLRLLRQPRVAVRFDIVEVLLEEGRVREVRHLPNAFPMQGGHRYY